MRSGTQFLLTLLAWVLFMVGGFSFLRFEGEHRPEVRAVVQPFLTTGLYTGVQNLNRVSGEQVLGMIPSALDGKYVLYVDGMRIDESTDLDALDLRRIPDASYQLSITRSNDKITQVQALR